MAANDLKAALLGICSAREEEVDLAPVMDAEQLNELLSNARTEEEIDRFIFSLAKSVRVGSIDLVDVM